MNLKLLSSVCLALTLPMAAQGQEEPKSLTGEAELGVLITSGNTEETNVNSRLGLTHEVEKWRNKGEFRSAYSEAEDDTTAEKYRASLESNYKFAERQFWFLRGFYEDDRFSGFEFQSSVTTGYGNRVWVQGERSFLDLTVGAGYRFNKLEVPDDTGSRDDDEAIARLAGQYDHALSENALFRQVLSVEVGLDDEETFTESETAIQANIVNSLSMKAAYLVQHLSDPPQGSERTDTQLTVSLLYGF